MLIQAHSNAGLLWIKTFFLFSVDIENVKEFSSRFVSFVFLQGVTNDKNADSSPRIV